MQGRWFCSATSWARRCFFTVSGKYEPPFTVASFATTTHSWPSTTPIAGDDAGRGRRTVVELPGGERVQLEEGAAGIDEPVDALPRGQLAARAVALHGALAAAARHEGRALASSATSASMRSLRRVNVSSRSSWEVSTPTRAA